MAQILELRVHGVSNTSPAEILCMEKSDTEDPHPTRVAGDDTTGFYRESARDPTAGLTTEAYSWGQLTSGARAAKDIERALWTVLLPFTLANIALPARTGIPADPVTERWSSRAGIAAWLIRLFCLSLTGTLVLAATGIGVDLIGWQCVDAACLRRIPGSWEFLSGGWWGAGARSLALGLLVPLAMLAVIGRLTWRTYQYEAELPAGPAGAPNTAPPVNPLQDPTFWCGEGQVRRAAVLHLCAGVSVAAAVPLAAVLHMDPPQGARAVLAWGTVALFALPAVITLIALGQPYLTRRAGKTPLGPWSVLIAVLTGAGLLGTMTLLLLPDGPAGVPMAQLRPPHGCLQDPTLPGCLQDRSLPGFDRLLASFGAAQALLLIAIGAVSRCGRRALALPAVALLAGGAAWCWRSGLLPLLPAAPQWLTTSVLAVATLGLAAAGLLLPRVEADQHGDDGAAWHGLGPAVLAALGWLLGIAYSAGMIYWTTDWLNGGSAPAGFSAITAPQPIGWAGLVFVVALAAVIVTVLRGWALFKRLRQEELAALAPEGSELSAHERRRCPRRRGLPGAAPADRRTRPHPQRPLRPHPGTAGPRRHRRCPLRQPAAGGPRPRRRSRRRLGRARPGHGRPRWRAARLAAGTGRRRRPAGLPQRHRPPLDRRDLGRRHLLAPRRAPARPAELRRTGGARAADPRRRPDGAGRRRSAPDGRR